MIKHTKILLLIIGVIVIIILVVSLILFLTIGLKIIEEKRSNLLNSWYNRCECGFLSIEPLFNNKTRIINGEIAHEHSCPWEMILVRIDRNRNAISFCGATLITERHLLTAAHSSFYIFISWSR